MLKDVSIIIPAAPHETAHEQLIKYLSDTRAEIIVSSEGTRAKSLNAGAAQADQNILWFLHADSRVHQENLMALEKSIMQYPDAIHYFDLGYSEGGLAALNAWGANIRSRLFGLPYGDQGFCMSKAVFQRLGGYPQNTPYGEDVLFIRLSLIHI